MNIQALQTLQLLELGQLQGNIVLVLKDSKGEKYSISNKWLILKQLHWHRYWRVSRKTFLVEDYATFLTTLGLRPRSTTQEDWFGSRWGSEVSMTCQITGDKYPLRVPFIYVLGTQPRQNVLGTCSRYTSIHITSTVKCSRYPFVQGWKWHASRSAQYDVLCIHCATCEVILMCTLRADSGLRAKPHPLRTLFSVHERSYLFWMCTKGAICSENMVWPCSSWNCSSRNNSL